MCISTRRYVYTNTPMYEHIMWIRQQSQAYRHIVYHKINLDEGLDELVISARPSTTTQPM